MLKTFIPKPYIPFLRHYRSKNYIVLQEFLELNMGAAEYIPDPKDTRNIYEIRQSLQRSANSNGLPILIFSKDNRIYFIREDIGDHD